MYVYVGTFLIALVTLALEVTLSRILSVVTWYHLAFFAISTAMLGMTAGAVTVYLKSNWFEHNKLDKSISLACLGFALVVPFSLSMLCLIPIRLEYSIMSFIALLITTIVCSLPFYFSGIAITAILTKYSLPIGKLYASDLIGASLGCIFVLGGLEVFDAPSLVLFFSVISVLACFAFIWKRLSRKNRLISLIIFMIYLTFPFINSSTILGIRPLVVKGNIEGLYNIFFEKWNSLSRVVVYNKAESISQYWGPSPVAPMENIEQYKMNIDGEAATVVRKYFSMEDIEHLRFDVTNIAYYLRQDGDAFIIGVGGGRDIQSAILFGHKRITGVDINPIFIELLKGEFREFAGIADRSNVNLKVAEARSYLTENNDTYDIIQMSLIDTWAATGAGAFTHSENSLYTIEAWQVILNRLKRNGIFTVSRWYNPDNIAETGRLVSLAIASLIRYGIQEPYKHIALITSDKISSIILCKEPFSQIDIAELNSVSESLKYNIAISPGIIPENPILRKIVMSSSMEELDMAIADMQFNYKPPTDENPYFFNLIRLDHLKSGLEYSSGVIYGNMIATITLVGLIISLFIIVIVTIVLPLYIKSRMEKNRNKKLKVLWSGAVYFSLIGAGFMFVEIALIQRLSIFLGHPVYALGILLFALILSTGIGSWLSGYLPLTRSPWIYIYPVVIVIFVLVTRFILSYLLIHTITYDLLYKILLSIMVIFPMGIVLGLCFPTGMKLVKLINNEETPWYWALNGIIGVLCSALAVFISIYWGISTNFYIAIFCYSGLLICLYHLNKILRARKVFNQNN